VAVRRARPEDAAAIAEVHVRTWQVAYEHVFGAEKLATLDPERRRDWWERSIRTGLEPVFVAESDGRIVAFANVGASQDADAGGQLYAIYALPDAWGTGVGHELMAACLGALRDAGHGDAILYVLEDNPRARRFYEREGWTLDGGTKTDEFLGVPVAEVRYRIRLD
jgi:GNAT superfamily N-acetyltransferase